jgi:hypothetical protein
MGTIPPSDENELRSEIADLSRRLAGAEAALKAAAGQKQVVPGALRAERPETPGTRAEALVHDLNNVFAPILMAAALLKEKVTDEKGVRMLTVLEDNAMRGAEIVRRMRDSAQADEARGTPPQTAAGKVQGAGDTVPPGNPAPEDPPPPKAPGSRRAE